MSEAVSNAKQPPDEVGQAMVAAWRAWALGLIVPGLWLVYVLGKMPRGQAAGAGGLIPGAGLGRALLVGSVVWLVLAGPAIFVLRSYCFRATWDGRAVLPASYLRGMGSIWAVLAVGAGLALAGAVFTRQPMPASAVAGAAMLLIAITPPSRRAMVGSA